MSSLDTGWTDTASDFFLEYGDVFTPSRREQTDMIARLVPAGSTEEFFAVDLGCGGGTLSAALLQNYPHCRVIALDGSVRMLEAASRRLAAWQNRVEFRLADLHREDWLRSLPDAVRCVVSSLAIHHLNSAEKRQLFLRLHDRLETGGALLVADIVEPVNRAAWTAYAAAWEEAVREQAASAGPPDALERFLESGWNYYDQPDTEFDKPSNIFDQLRWLAEAHYQHVDCFWLRAGHAVYGGYV